MTSTIHKVVFGIAAACAALAAQPATAQQAESFKLGIVTFLSGAAAGPFGVPARNAAELTIETLNAGKMPAPYEKKGINGLPIEMVITDEAGGTTKQVTEYRNLVQRANVDAIIGYISSGDCLAIAPLADELKKLTIFFDCGTPRIFEDATYRYLFRTGAHATMDNVAAARYLLARNKT
jgi:branched-chain amino acid transport system substrate-binding protein